MHGRETVEAFLAAKARGLDTPEAAREAGVAPGTAFDWAAGILPHSYTGVPAERPPRRARMTRMAAAGHPEAPLDESERAAYDAAMEENILLRAVLDDLKGAGSHPASISNRRKCELGERLRRATGLPLRSITAFLRISKSSYEYHRARLGRDRDADIRAEVVRLFEEEGDRSWGYRAVWARLRAAGTPASEKRVRRVMREEGLRPVFLRARARAYSSYAGEEGMAGAPNLLLLDETRNAHEFRAPAPGLVYATDITEFRLPSAGKVYLSAMVDLHDGRPAAWAVGPSPNKALVRSMLEAGARTFANRTAILHSDRGWHYRTPEWVALCGRLGVVRSLSRKGRSPDNAACEGFFGRLKNEFFHGRDWSGVTAGEFAARLDAYLRYYCEERLKRSLGWLSPDQYRRRLGYAV